jgi:hypothetical protein
MLLVIEEPGGRRRRSAEVAQRQYDRMMGFAGDLKARGILLAAESLTADSEGARVTSRDGRRNIVDGPFAEAKEVVGGFFLLDCDRETALALAAECPAAEWSTIEVRPVGPCIVTGTQ